MAELKIKGISANTDSSKKNHKKPKKDKKVNKGNTIDSVRQKKKRKKEKIDRLENKQRKVLRQTPSLLPFLQMHDNYTMMKDRVMEIYQVETKDLYTRNETDLNVIIHGLAGFYRSYTDAIKIIGLNFPCNTESQRNYWLQKQEKAIDPVRIQFIQRKLFELDFLEKERTNREFFLFIYADNDEQLQERKKMAERLMHNAFALHDMNAKKKQDVLFMLNNQNTKL